MVTGVRTVPPAGALTDPPGGPNASPAAAPAVQVTVWPLVPRVLSTTTDAWADPPGASRTWPGSTATEARVVGGNRTGPAPNDGGASPGPVPQRVSGRSGRSKRSLVTPRSGRR